MIWAMTALRLAYTLGPLRNWILPSTRSCSSIVALNNRNSPPKSRMRSRPDSASPATVSRGAVSVTIQEIVVSKPSRISIARPRPISLAFSR